MACHSCKSKGTAQPKLDGKDGTNIFTRVIYFIIGTVVILLLVPVVAVIGIYMLFNTSILDKPTELLPSFSFIGNMFLNKNDVVEDEDFSDIEEDFDPNDYELIGVEEIKK